MNNENKLKLIHEMDDSFYYLMDRIHNEGLNLTETKCIIEKLSWQWKVLMKELDLPRELEK